MDEQGLWKLFLATGSPRVWLTMRALQQEQKKRIQAVPAYGTVRPKQI